MKKWVYLIAAILLIFSALSVYAYPVNVKVTGLSGVGDFYTDVYHCTDPACSSMIHYESDHGNPNTYTLHDEGSGKQHFAEFDYQECFVPFIYRMGVDGSTCSDCFDYNITFYKEPDCCAPVLSVELSNDTVYKGDHVFVGGTVRSVWLMPPDLPDLVIPTGLRSNYSNHIGVFLYVDGSSIENTTTDIVWNETSDVNFSFTAWLEPGEHPVGIYTKVDNDCECSGSSFRDKTTTLTVVAACGNGIVNTWEQCELPLTPDNTYCNQTESDCNGNKLGTRDMFGDCDSSCSCMEDPFTYACVKDFCGAECGNDNDCDANTCSETYYDYCDGKKLVEYDSNKVMDSTVVADVCENGCLGDCECTDCEVDCSALETNSYCVEGVCNAPCDQASDYLLDDSTCFYNCDAGSSCDYQDSCPTENYCSDSTWYHDGKCSESGCGHESTDCSDFNYVEGPYVVCNMSHLVHYYIFHEFGCHPANGCVEIDMGHYNYTVIEDCDMYDGNITEECGVEDWTCSGISLSCEIRNTTPDNSLCPNFCDSKIRNYDGTCNPSTYLCGYQTEDCSGYDGNYCSDSESIEARTYYCDPDKCLYDTSGPTDCGTELWFGGTDTLGYGADPDCSYKDFFCTGTGPNAYCDSAQMYNSSFDYMDNPSVCFGKKSGLADYWCDLLQCDPIDPLNDCGPGSTNYTFFCSFGCGAECELDNDCDASECSETYYDYCNEKKLVEYDSDRVKDSTTVEDSCENTCQNNCSCTDCDADCSPPTTNEYCVRCTCGAECDDDSHCPDTDCNHLDGCVGNDYHDYDDVPNTCLDSCECTDSQCGSPTIYPNDPRCTECQTDDDCNKLDKDYCDGDLILHDEGRCIDYSCEVETTTTYDCNDDNHDYCNGTEIKHADYTCDSASCVIDTITTVKDCDNGLYCDGKETCEDAACLSGTPIDCSWANIDLIATCFNDPDSNPLTWDYFQGFTSMCDEDTDSCTTGTLTLVHTCNISECGADCEDNDDCEANECSETYYDYCNGKKLVEYDSDKVKDLTTIEDSCENACQDNCSCTDCDVDCSPSETNEYCVRCTCGAECDDDSHCPDTDCDHLDGCVGNDYHDYDDVPNSCLGSCECTDNQCGSPTIYPNDPRCTECQKDDDCDELDKDYCDGDLILHDEGRCIDYSCEAENTTTYDCNDDNHDYCNGTEIKHADYTCNAASCVLDQTTTVKDCDDDLYCNGQESCQDASCQPGIPVDCNDEVGCTDDSCNEQTDSCDNIENDSLCDDGLYCNGIEYCDAINDCQPGTPIDCSTFNIPGIAQCDYSPDDNPLTWDYFQGFTSECDEDTDSCTTGTLTLVHTCNISECGAECDEDTDCAPTDCDELDSCVGNDYHDYDDVPNTCLDSCECMDNQCGSPTIYPNDPRCTECQTDDDCDELDKDYCDGDLILHDEGRCIDYSCEAETTTTYDCNDDNHDYCNGTEIKHADYKCDSASCVIDTITTVKDCDNSLYCDGKETCEDAACVPGIPVDCSWANIEPIATCFNDPDSNPLTWDYFQGFTSECDEDTDSCTTGTLTLVHTCNISECGADCEKRTDCPANITDDICYHPTECELCECVYGHEFCPPSGTVVDDICYYGTRTCDADGCVIEQCQLEDLDRCDPERGCVECVYIGTIIDQFRDESYQKMLYFPFDNYSNSDAQISHNFENLVILSANLNATGLPVNVTFVGMVDAALVEDVSGSMDDDCGPDGTAQPGETPCKINDKKEADIEFVNTLLDNNESNMIALVAYSTYVVDSLPLTNDKDLLLSHIDSYMAGGTTCISCGIGDGTQLLKDGTNPRRAIILLSDGKANECIGGHCNLDEASEEAINKSREAWEVYNITVYALAYGADADTGTMQEIADAGHGKYYYAENLNISDLYAQLGEQLISSYPANPTMDVGSDAGIEWHYPGLFDTKDEINFSDELNDIILSNCTCPGCSIQGDKCVIDLLLFSEKAGRILLDGLNITACTYEEFEYLCSDNDNDSYYAHDPANCPYGNDCDDSDPEVHPGAAEICNEKDDDCDGVADNITRSCYTGPAGTNGVGICHGGTQTCVNGTWSDCLEEVTPVKEVCNDGLDNDCDGSTDKKDSDCKSSGGGYHGRGRGHWCGDGVCNLDESCLACPEDCGECPPEEPLFNFEVCSEDWSCTAWSDCQPDGAQARTCSDSNNCGTTANKPEEIRNCMHGSFCVEDWSCTAWSDCQPDGTHARTCSDANACGTAKNRPAESQSCTYAPPAGGGGITGFIVQNPAGGIGVAAVIIVILASLIYWKTRKGY